jgi:hypothetical protein
MRKGASIARNNPNAQPKQIVRAALKQAATQYAPGLLAKNAGMGRGQNGSGIQSNSGNWVRRGRTLIIYNA